MRYRDQPISYAEVCSQLIILWLAMALVPVLTNSSAAQTCFPCAQVLAPGVGYFTKYGPPLYWTSDNGTHWIDLALPTAVSQGQILSVYFLNPSTGWVLFGEAGDAEPTFELASTNNSGASWSVMRADLPINPNEYILLPQGDINFTDADHGWMNVSVESGAAFHLGVLFRTVDGGRKWIFVGAPGTEGKVRFIDRRNGWVLSGASGELWATHDSGANWSEVSVQVPARLLGRSVAEYQMPMFRNSRWGALLVDFSPPPADPETEKTGTDVALYTTVDAGKTWKFASLVAHFSFPNSGVVAGMVDSTLITAQRTGNTLTTQRIPLDAPAHASATSFDLGFTGGVMSLTFATARQGWIVTTSASCVPGPGAGCALEQLFATSDGGATWKNIMPGALLPSTPPPPASKPIPLVWKCCINPCKDSQTKQSVDCRTGKAIK